MSAIISDDGMYRYQLTRRWGASNRLALFIMINPSTADATEDDRTIGRCIGFAKREGCDGLRVVNLYAFRTREPDEMFAAADKGVDIVGPENDTWIAGGVDEAVANDSPIVAAWGADARISPHRVHRVKSLPGMQYAQALKLTKSGAPGHPLYVKGDAPLISLTRGATS